MALHLIGTAFHAGKTVVNACKGDERRAKAEALKTAASLIPGGGIVAGAMIGRAIDEAVIEGSSGTARALAHNAWENRDEITDNVTDAVSNFFESI